MDDQEFIDLQGKTCCFCEQEIHPPLRVVQCFTCGDWVHFNCSGIGAGRLSLWGVRECCNCLFTALEEVKAEDEEIPVPEEAGSEEQEPEEEPEPERQKPEQDSPAKKQRKQ